MRLTLDGICFAYGRRQVLRDISFQLDRGRILAVLGVNGAGKSTLLKCINGILRPLRGRIHLGEKDILKLSKNDVAQYMGYVPQSYGEDQMTVFEAVLLGRKPYIKWAPDARDLVIVENTLRLMNLEEAALRRVDELSGGEAQKVVLARAFAQKTQVLLLDEPTSKLDLKNQLEVMGLIKNAVRRRKLHALVAIHDLNLSLRFADDFLLLKDGKVHAFVERSNMRPEMIQEVFGVGVRLENIGGVRIVIPFERQSHEADTTTP